MINKYWPSSFIISLLLVFFISFFITPFNWLYATYSLLSFSIVISTFFMFYLTKDSKHIIIFIPLFMTWLYFMAPYLYPELIQHAYRIIPIDYLPQISFYSMMSIFMIFFGYYFINISSNMKYPQSLSNVKLEQLFYIFIVVAVLQRLIELYAHWILLPFGEILQILEFSQVLTVCIGVLYWLRKGDSSIIKILTILFFIFDLLFRISDTLYSKVIYLLVSMLLVYIINQKRIPWKIIILVFIFIFPPFVLRKANRSEVIERWYFGGKKLSLLESVSHGAGYLVDSYKIWEWDEFSDELENQGMTRFENLSYLGQCVYMVKNQGKGLKYGETFWWLPFTVIPRKIVPWKPVNYHPTLLAEEYGTKGFAKGAMNFPILVEMFINFGFYGMIIFSFFQGALINWILSKVNYGIGDINLLIFINLLWHLVKVESNITMIMGGMLQVLVSWGIIFFILGIKWNQNLK